MKPKNLEKINEDRKKHGRKASEVQKQSNTVQMKKTVKLVQGEMLDFLRNALLEEDPETGRRYYEDYIKRFLDDAKKNPQGRCSRMLGSGLFSEETLAKLDSSVEALIKKDSDFLKYRISNTLYDKQKEIFNNENDKNVIAICSRRVGKTELAARLLVWHALKNPGLVAYISLKHETGMRQCFPLVDKLLTDLNLPHATKYSLGEIEVQQSRILFKGNANRAQADTQFRGDKYNAVVVDEAQTQCNLEYLIDTVLGPALADTHGYLYLIGTPPRNKSNAVLKLWNENGWKHYNWNMFSNPYMQAEEYVAKVCERKNLTIDAPFIQREYFGVLGVYDTEAQVFHPQVYEKVPSNFKPIEAFIGVDQGTLDFDSFAVVLAGVQDNKVCFYVTEEYKKNKETIKEFSIALKEAIARLTVPFSVVVDSAATAFAFELQQTYNVPRVSMAYKYDKETSIRQLEELFATGRCLVKEDGYIYTEAQNVLYERLEDDTITSRIDDSIYHPDILDALRYAIRQAIYRYSKELGIDDVPKSAKPLDLKPGLTGRRG